MRRQDDALPARQGLGQLLVLAVLLLGCGPLFSSAASSDLDQRSPEDLQMEKLLVEGEVIDTEPISEGITGSRRLTLRDPGQQTRAIFKTVDEQTCEVVHTGRFELGFSDRYAYEVAAYRLDRVLGLGLVPVTVIREVDGERGSVQEWIEHVITLREAIADPSQDEAGDMDLACLRLTYMYVLDSLICNTDRNRDNILVDPASDRFFLIDHSRSFRIGRKVEPLQGGYAVPLPAEVVERLRGLDCPTLEAELGELLTKAQIRAVIARRDKLLKKLAKQGLLRGSEAS